MSSTTFSVGDVVRVLPSAGKYTAHSRIGTEFVISRVINTNGAPYAIDDGGSGFYLRDLEHAVSFDRLEVLS